MTLVFRNKLLLVLLSILILFLLVTGIYFVYAIVTKGLFIPTEVRRLIDLPNILFFRYNFFAAIGSSFILFLYSMVTMYICYRNFEKTQAAEIIYFVGFCIGCALEGFRIWSPFFCFLENRFFLEDLSLFSIYQPWQYYQKTKTVNNFTTVAL